MDDPIGKRKPFPTEFYKNLDTADLFGRDPLSDKKQRIRYGKTRLIERERTNTKKCEDNSGPENDQALNQNTSLPPKADPHLARDPNNKERI